MREERVGDSPSGPGRVLGRIRLGMARRLTALSGRLTAGGWTAAEAIADGVVLVVGRSRRAWRSRPGARARRLRALAGRPLPDLYLVHPEARRAHAIEIGLRSIPLDEIAGTAVSGSAQRGSDFRPLPRFRSRNWSSRWARIRGAVERLEVLPPIDVVRYADRYWVVDGHNRVAAGLAVGQAEIDAAVTELVPPGGTVSERPEGVASMLPGARAARAAGEGRWTRTAALDASDEEEAALDRLTDGSGPPPTSADG